MPDLCSILVKNIENALKPFITTLFCNLGFYESPLNTNIYNLYLFNIS